MELEETYSDSVPIKASISAGLEVVVASRTFNVQRRVAPPLYFSVSRPVSSPQLSKKIDISSVSPIPPPTYEDCLPLASRKSLVAEAVRGLKANRVIGHGGFSKVYAAEIGTTGKHMAVKLLDKAKIWNKFGDPGLETITQEQSILRKIAELGIEGCANLLLSAHDEQFAIIGMVSVIYILRMRVTADGIDRNIVLLVMYRKNLNVRDDYLSNVHPIYSPVWYVFDAVVVSIISDLPTPCSIGTYTREVGRQQHYTPRYETAERRLGQRWHPKNHRFRPRSYTQWTSH